MARLLDLSIGLMQKILGIDQVLLVAGNYLHAKGEHVFT